MPDFTVRSFRRDDRDQLTGLVNAHVAATVPGLSVSVNAVLSQLARDTGEFVVDPWVVERSTLVAEQRGRVVAAAHVLRYGSDDTVGPAYRNVGEVCWLVYWPVAPDGPAARFIPDCVPAAEALLTACLAQFARWRVGSLTAGGDLPAPTFCGVPDQWPHIADLYERAGFRHTRTEFLLLADVVDLPTPDEAPGMTVRRSVGINGTRLTLDRAGYIEIDTNLHGTGRFTPHAAWADIGNLHVTDPALDYETTATALVAHAADWSRLARVDRLLAYSGPEPDDAAELRLLTALGFRVLTRYRCGWVRRP
ncbi:N-acetyltransferase family protein [Streptomyces sp. WAC 04229]|uniref:GNAT family N-acetyltransferase n=1 Tax=Streptomyces sp. WAC 04229 TaxID=2203206 RepID=UPI003D75B7E0